MTSTALDFRTFGTSWQDSPETFLQTKYGTVRAVWQLGRVYVNVASEAGQAHVNDDRPALTYRGQEYIGSLHLALGPAGFALDGRSSLTRRPQWTDPPRTHGEALTAAIVDAVTTHHASTDPSAMDRGGLASLAQAAYHQRRDIALARTELAKLEAALAATLAAAEEIAEQI